MNMSEPWKNCRLFSRRKEVLTAASLLTISIAFLDWLVVRHYSIGFLYVFPIILAAGFLKRWQIVALALVCGFLRELFSPFYADPDSLPRLATIIFGFTGAGLFVSELAKNRLSALAHVRRLTTEIEMRMAAQQRLQA